MFNLREEKTINCPTCERELSQIEKGGVELDVCSNGCGGIWFDKFELKRFDEPNESAGEDLLNIEKDPSLTVDQSQRYKCPKCNSMIMMRHFLPLKKK